MSFGRLNLCFHKFKILREKPNIYLNWENAVMVREILSKVFCSLHMVRVRDRDFPGVFEVSVRSCPITPLLSVLSALGYDWLPLHHA